MYIWPMPEVVVYEKGCLKILCMCACVLTTKRSRKWKKCMSQLYSTHMFWVLKQLTGINELGWLYCIHVASWPTVYLVSSRCICLPYTNLHRSQRLRLSCCQCVCKLQEGWSALLQLTSSTEIWLPAIACEWCTDLCSEHSVRIVVCCTGSVWDVQRIK